MLQPRARQPRPLCCKPPSTAPMSSQDASTAKSLEASSSAGGADPEDAVWHPDKDPELPKVLYEAIYPKNDIRIPI